MEKKYFKITKENKDIVYKIMIGNFEPVILVYCYNSIGNTYSGFRFECFIDGVKMLLRTYPNFLLDVEHSGDLNQWFKINNFIEIEPTELDLILYNK